MKKKAVYIDEICYPSIFTAAIDMEMSYPHLYEALHKNDGAPTVYGGHIVMLSAWLSAHPEYEIGDKP